MGRLPKLSKSAKLAWSNRGFSDGRYGDGESQSMVELAERTSPEAASAYKAGVVAGVRERQKAQVA